MRKVTYIGVFEPCDSGYAVYFPDIPGCTSFGTTFQNACAQASEALGLHLYSLEKDGDEVPAPTDQPVVDPETAAGFLLTPVTVFPEIVRNELDNKAVKTNLTIPAWLKEMAEEQGVNFSQVLQVSLLEILNEV